LGTHAWVDESQLGGSVLALSPGDAEDGLVLADDLASLRLDADLVTLSACATARGVDVQAEGLVGLTVPLLESGARAVLATAWRVDDAETARFMAGFYRELARGLAVGDALHRTKAAARRRGAPVNVWSAFTLVGDATIRPHLAPVP
ncbi:MAG: CHAT domain-containing protein, partial [Gemmatimonadetes bacterium]|nr:CHAT domain-containing protein [Gemmatimonadota bacterium]